MRKEGVRSGLRLWALVVVVSTIILMLLVCSAMGESDGSELLMESLASDRLLQGMKPYITYDALGKQHVCGGTNCVKRVNRYGRPCIYKNQCRS